MTKLNLNIYPDYPEDPLPFEALTDENIKAIVDAFDDADLEGIERAMTWDGECFGSGYSGVYFDQLPESAIESYSYTIDSTENEGAKEGVFNTYSGVCGHFCGYDHVDEGVTINAISIFPSSSYPQLKASVEQKVFRKLMLRAIETLQDMPADTKLAVIHDCIRQNPALQAAKEAESLLAAASQTPSDSNKGSFSRKAKP